MLYLRNSNQMQSLADNISGVQRGVLPNISASVTSSCIDYEGSGVIDINDIVGGKGPLYNYSLYDLSASVYITQSTTISSASIEDLNNSTYLVKLDNLGLFAYTQSVAINCPPPPNLEVQYLIVGGGSATYLTGTGGSGGGFVSASASIPWRTTVATVVGLGGNDTAGATGQSSSISASGLGVFGAGGADFDNSGGPQYFSAGLTGPGGTYGGGAGASANGNNGVLGQNGDGGDGLTWLNGIYYAGGGGGVGDPTLPSNPGAAGLGGGGYNTENGVDGLGGGAGGSGSVGGSGVVIIRYATGSVRPAFGGTTEISGGYVYHTFTGSATFTYGPQ